MAAEWVIGLRSWQQGRELLPDGLDDVGWDVAGMSMFLFREASTTPRMMEYLVPNFYAPPIPIGGSS
jgi:hypothetical protein